MSTLSALAQQVGLCRFFPSSAWMPLTPLNWIQEETWFGIHFSAAGKPVAADPTGNVYVVGFCKSTWGSPIRPFGGVQNAFAARLDSNGNLIWNTFLGGTTGQDVGLGVALSLSGNVYVAGISDTSWGTPSPAFNGGIDAFVAQLNS